MNCPKCNTKMIELFISFVCDSCEKKKQGYVMVVVSLDGVVYGLDITSCVEIKGNRYIPCEYVSLGAGFFEVHAQGKIFRVFRIMLRDGKKELIPIEGL